MPITAAFKYVRPQIGNNELALNELRRLLADGRLRSLMRFQKNSGPLQRKLLAAAFWEDVEPYLDKQGEVLLLGSEGDENDGGYFVWKPDLLNIFRGGEVAPQAASKQQEKPVKIGAPLKHDWIFLTLEASWLIRNNSGITQADFIDKLSLTLEQQSKEVPVFSELQTLFKQVLAFEKKPRKVRR